MVKKLYVVLLLLFALFGLILVIKTNAINRFDTMIGKGQQARKEKNQSRCCYGIYMNEDRVLTLNFSTWTIKVEVLKFFYSE